MKKLLSMGLLLMMVALLSGCSSAANYYKEGKKNFIKEDYDKAAVNFSKAIIKNPNRGDYYIDYGLALTALGNYEEALKQFDKAYVDKDLSVIQKNNKRLFRGRGIVYYNMQNYDKAIAEFNNALLVSKSPSLDRDILYYMGSSLKIIGSYEEALKTYTEILTGKGKKAQAYADRGYCYRKMGMMDQSLADYDSAILLEPNNYEYYFGKYYLLLEDFNDKGKAKEVLAQAGDIKAETEEDKYNQAKLHYYQENYDVALSELESSFNSGFYEAYYYIGEIYQMNKDYSKAIYYYDKLIDTEKVSVSNVYNQAAVCLMKTGDYKKAAKYLEKGILFQDSGTLQVLKKNEIIVYELLGEFKTAEEKMGEYLAKYPQDKDALREAEFIKTRTMNAVTREQ